MNGTPLRAERGVDRGVVFLFLTFSASWAGSKFTFGGLSGLRHCTRPFQGDFGSRCEEPSSDSSTAPSVGGLANRKRDDRLPLIDGQAPEVTGAQASAA